MFDIERFDKSLLAGLLAGSNVLRGYNVRLDIFTPMEPEGLVSLIDHAYEEAEKKADEAAGDPEKQRVYEASRSYRSHYTAPPLNPKDGFMEGPAGPPLGKSRKWDRGVYHPILKTVERRDYELPHDGWAYSMVRERLSGDEGYFHVFPFDRKTTHIDDDSVHGRFGFQARSDICLPEFVLGMIDLYGNYGPQALQAKMLYAEPTKEEGMAQRDSIKKLTALLHDSSVPFYVTFHNPRNKVSVLVYGENPVRVISAK